MNNIYKIINRERKLLLRTKIFKLSIPGKLKYFSTHLVDLLSLLFTSSFKSEKKRPMLFWIVFFLILYYIPEF